MFKAVTDIFRSDEFIQSSAVFPDIDQARILKELNLKEEGEKRGRDNQPETASDSFDHIEAKIVSKIDSLRRRGLENFETNRQVYSERLNRAVSAKSLVETEANDAKAKFNEEITKWKSRMVTSREAVQEAFAWRKAFRLQNGLIRPAQETGSLLALIAIGFVMIIAESVFNMYLFAQKNTLGFLGGAFAAFLVSLVNVSVCTLFGIFSRYLNCRGFRNVLKKLFGLLAVSLWIAFSVVYNLGVAHFRDSVEQFGDWREAGVNAIESITSNPIYLHTMESYILLLLGMIISVLAFLKGCYFSDPYPGYARVNDDVISAREGYIDELEESIQELSDHRDSAVNGLRAANDEVHRNINDSIDALYGQRALHSNLAPFLEQCNIATNFLLAVYRDANKGARSEDAPPHFNREYSFEAFEVPDEDLERRANAEQQTKEVAGLVDTSISEIFQVFEKAVSSHYEIDELEGTRIEKRAKGEEDR